MMKCLYSVPGGASERLRQACAEYARALREWNTGAANVSDWLGELAEETSRGRLCIEQEAWNGLRAQMKERSSDLPLAEIFWAPTDARRIADAIRALGPTTTSRAESVQAWLRAEADAGRAIVALMK